MKDAILKLAEAQLMTGGYGKLNFGQIATALDTTRANLHYHFKNKESLAIAVTEDFGTRQVAAFHAMRDAFKGNFAGYVQMLDDSFWAPETDPEDLRSCTLLAADPDLPAPLRVLTEAFYRDVNASLVATLEDAKAAGEIRNDIDCQREANRAHTLMMGLMTSIQHMPNRDAARAALGGLLTDWAAGLT
jgi:AcrR family transcriptional regulator